MGRLKKQERQKQLAEKLNITPFVTDEELAQHFSVSVPTIRLDRLELGIPELRERIKAMATEHSNEFVAIPHQDLVGDLIDLTEGQQALSMLQTTSDMVDGSGKSRNWRSCGNRWCREYKTQKTRNGWG